MNYDLFLGIDTAILAVLGGIVSAHGPTVKKHKIRYGLVFIGLGVIAIVVIMLQSRDFQRARGESQRELAELKARLDSSLASQNHMQGQLEGIYLLVAKAEASSEKQRQFALSVQKLISHSLKQRSLLLANKMQLYIKEHPLKVGPHMKDPLWRFQTSKEDPEVHAFDQDFSEKTASLRKEFGGEIETINKEFNDRGLDTTSLRRLLDRDDMFQVPDALRRLAAQIDDQGHLLQ